MIIFIRLWLCFAWRAAHGTYRRIRMRDLEFDVVPHKGLVYLDTYPTGEAHVVHIITQEVYSLQAAQGCWCLEYLDDAGDKAYVFDENNRN